MLRAIIVDDEELSVKRLKRMLSENTDIEVCHTFLSPTDGYEYVKTNSIQIAFLDISMPEINGMSLSSLLRELDNTIEIVFVTGYDQYAVQAFDMNALDYLLKPVTRERLSKTVERIRKKRRIVDVESKPEVHLFNGLRLYQNYPERRLIKLRSPKTEELFAYLVCKGKVSREEIFDTLWSGLEPKKAQQNLNTTMHYVRKAVNSGNRGECIEADRNEIRINESEIYSDMYAFETLMRQVRIESKPGLELLLKAEALYTGEFLKGKSYEWANDKRRQLEQDYIKLLELIAIQQVEQNEPIKALQYYSEILKVDWLREDIHRDIIYLYIELGRKNDAVRQYRVMVEMLEQELGMGPDPQLEQVMDDLVT